MTAILDIREGTSISEDNDGFRVERQAIVESVTGNASTRIYNAITDAQLPNIGDAHPDISSITLQEKRGEVIDGQTVRVTLSYYFDPGQNTGSSNATLSASGSTVKEETKHDFNGDPIIAYFSPAGGNNLAVPGTGETDIPRAQFAFTYQSTTYPRAEIDTYAGKVNSSEWNGYAAKTILCTSVDVTPQEADYEVRFNFTYAPENWQFEFSVASYGLPLSTHATITDSELDLTTGKKLYDLLGEVDFTPLGFTIDGPYCVISGTAAPSCTEAQIVSGGRTIILTLTGDTWVASGATFDAQRANIIAGLTAGNDPSNSVGWNDLSIAVTDCVRSSDTVVTITLSAQASFSIAKSQIVKCVVPASALTTSTHPLTVSQRFKIVA